MTLITLLFWWHLFGWIAICMRPFAAKNFEFIMQTLDICEFVGIMGGGFIMWFVYFIFIMEYLLKGQTCPVIWRNRK